MNAHEPMLLAFIALVILQPPAAQPAGRGTLECYATYTQIGTVAVRRFSDALDLIEKEIFYTSDDLTCTPAKLRVQQTVTYERDREGRAIVAIHYDPGGRVRQTWTIEYDGSGNEFYTRTAYGPDGRRERQIRQTMAGHTVLGFDEAGRVAALDGRQPDDIPSALAWGEVVDGWSCGLGIPAVALAAGGGRVVVHLWNHTDRDQSVAFSRAFEADLRDASGSYVAETPEYRAGEPEPFGKGPRGLIEAGSARYHYAVDLDRRYGRLPPGSYTLRVRHPHPFTVATLVSGTVTIEIR